MAGGKGTIGLSGKSSGLEGGREDFKGQSAYTAGRAFDQIIYQSQRNEAGESWMRAGKMMAAAADKMGGALADWAVEKEKAENAINVSAVQTDMEVAGEKLKTQLDKDFTGTQSGGGEAYVRSEVAQFRESQRGRIEKITDPKIRAQLEDRLKVAEQRLVSAAVENDVKETGKVLISSYNEAAAVFQDAVKRNPDLMKDEAMRAGNGAFSAMVDLEKQMVERLKMDPKVLESKRNRIMEEGAKVAMEVDTAKVLDYIVTGGDLKKAKGLGDSLFKEYERAPLDADKRHEMKLKIDKAIESEVRSREFESRQRKSEERVELQFRYQTAKEKRMQLAQEAMSAPVPAEKRPEALRRFEEAAGLEYDAEVALSAAQRGEGAKRGRKELADARAEKVDAQVEAYKTILNRRGGPL